MQICCVTFVSAWARDGAAWREAGSERCGGLLDIDGLAKAVGLGVQNQDLVFSGHNRNPTGSKGHSLGCSACG